MPKEYIEREVAINDVRSIPISSDFTGSIVEIGVEKAIKVLNKVPAADVVEVVHAKWKLHKDGSGTCLHCFKWQKNVWDYDNWQNYCGCCGAKMDLED